MLSRPRRSGGRGCAAPLAPALPLRMEGDGRGRRKKSARPPPWTSGQPERLAVESGSPLPHDSSTNVRVCQAPLRGLAHPAAAEGTARQGPPPGRPGLSLAGGAPMWHPEARRGGAKRRPAGPQAPPGGRSPGGPKGRAPEGGRRGRGPRPGAGAQGRGRSGAEGDHREHAAAQGRPQAPAPSPRRGRGPPPQAPPARGADRRSGRRRGATRSRATGAGGAAAARGHRSDPWGAEGRPAQPGGPKPDEGRAQGGAAARSAPEEGPQGRAHHRRPRAQRGATARATGPTGHRPGGPTSAPGGGQARRRSRAAPLLRKCPAPLLDTGTVFRHPPGP